MRLKLTAKVDGYIRTNEPKLSCFRGDITWELEADSSGLVTAASASCRVPPERLPNFRSAIVQGAPGARIAAHVTIGGDAEIHERLETALRSLETALGHTHTGPLVRHIRWHEASTEFIAETEEEADQLVITGFSTGPAPGKRSVLVTQDALQQLVDAASRHETVDFASSLWREGASRLDDGQYLDALHYYFLALEDLFADGYTGRKQALAAFRADPLCQRVLAASLKTVEGHPQLYIDLKAMFDERGNPWSVDGAIDFLYSMRGQLSHASSRRRALKAKWRHQGAFRPLAVFAMHVVNHSLWLKKVALNRAAKGMPPE